MFLLVCHVARAFLQLSAGNGESKAGKTEMWKESETRIVFRTKVKERDKVVISNAAVELYAEIPKAATKAQPAAVTSPSAVPATPGG